MRRILKIVGILLLLLIIGIFTAPYLFKDKLENLVKTTINNNLNATVTWEQLDLSLWRSFPDAALSIKEFSIVNHAPFAGDTLAQGAHLQIDMGISQLFKKADDDPIAVNALLLDKVRAHIQVDSMGNANYDIAKKSEGEGQAPEPETTPFSFAVQEYELRNSIISYKDASSGVHLIMEEVNHIGSGDFSAIESTLSTQTDMRTSLSMGDINYLKNHGIHLQADLNMDLENQKYTFLENKLLINALPLAFDGYMQLSEDSTSLDLTFETPESDFKNFLALIPETYSKNLDDVDTQGDFRIQGKIKGAITEERIPELDISITSDNASFKYPDLPKRMDNINIDAQIKNTSGLPKDTYITLHNINFSIDQDAFTLQGSLRNLTANMLVQMGVKGTLNLAHIEKVYPLDLEHPLQGLLNADLTTTFDMNSIERQQYQHIKSTGTARLSDFSYTTEELPKPLSISEADVTFQPGTILLNTFDGQSGQTDIHATGKIQNLIPFLMSKEDLKGHFKVQSQVFDMNDFAVNESIPEGTSKTAGTSTEEEAIKIPDFLDASMDFTAQKVIYDEIELTGVSGLVAIQDEQAQLTDVTSDIFGGDAGFNGRVSTKEDIPVFDMALDLNSIDIDTSFEKLDLLKGLAPIAKALQGALNTEIKLKGSLDKDMSPLLNSIAGDAFAQLVTADIKPGQVPLIDQLDQELDFIDLSKIDLSKLKTKLQFKDGNVVVAPFDIKIDDITMKVNGGHSFDNTMNYTLAMDIPAQYFGDKVGGLLSRLTEKEQQQLFVNLPVGISGNMTQPKININTASAVTDLTNKIIEIQKKRLIDKGTGKLDDILGDIIGGSSNTPKDSTSTGSSGTNEVIKDIAGDLLGNLWGKKKKKKETVKDSIPNR